MELLKVFVYRNLHKKCYSVKDWKTKKVIAYVNQIIIKDAKFKVSQAGRKKALKENNNKVHSGVLGFWFKEKGFLLENISIQYDLHKHETFVMKDNHKAIYKAKFVFLHENGVSI